MSSALMMSLFLAYSDGRLAPPYLGDIPYAMCALPNVSEAKLWVAWHLAACKHHQSYPDNGSRVLWHRCRQSYHSRALGVWNKVEKAARSWERQQKNPTYLELLEVRRALGCLLRLIGEDNLFRGNLPDLFDFAINADTGEVVTWPPYPWP